MVVADKEGSSGYWNKYILANNLSEWSSNETPYYAPIGLEGKVFIYFSGFDNGGEGIYLEWSFDGSIWFKIYNLDASEYTILIGDLISAKNGILGKRGSNTVGLEPNIVPGNFVRIRVGTIGNVIALGEIGVLTK